MDANFEILELVKFLVTAMADLKLQLLERIVQSRSSAQPDSNLPGETTELHKKIICQAVEDRICKRRDLATRADLTERQATDALCLLVKIVRRSGLPAHFSSPEIALLTRGTRAGCPRVPLRSTLGSDGYHHTTFEYGSFDDLMLSFARLKDLGIEPEFCLNHGVATSLYYADPDQNLVELQVDNFGNWDASAEWMRKSEDFRQNPVGAFFDPDRVLAAHKAGATFEQLQKDTYAGKYPPSKPPNEHVPSRR